MTLKIPGYGDYEVDPKYFADKYNMPVGERIQQPGLQLSRPFFD